MNLLIVTPYFPPQTGGVATFADLLQRSLRERGHQVYVIAPGSSDRITSRPVLTETPVYEFYLRSLWVPDAPVKGFLAFLFYFVPTLLKLRRFVEEKAFDLILLEYPMPYMCYFYLLKLEMGVKLIVGIHGDDVLSMHLAPKHEQWLVKQIIRRSDWLVAHSSSLMSQAETVVGQLNKNRSCIPYGIESRQLGALAKEEVQDYTLPPLPYVLTVAKLYERKGLDVLLRAIKALAATVDGYCFVIVGDGPEEQALKQLASRLGIEDAVVFTGELQKEKIVRLYQNCEFFVLPSRSEPFGIVLLEAMAFGKALVATKVGGIPEFVTDGFNGILAPPNDFTFLAESIARLINNTGLRSKIGKNGLNLVEKQYDFRVIVDHYVELFQQIVNDESPIS